MKFDAFTAGVNLGGLRSKNDIKLLICYMLTSVGEPLSKDEVVSVLQENGLANYFEINDAFSALIGSNNIAPAADADSKYVITESGKLIATQLDTALPITIREKTLAAAIDLLAKVKRETENTVTIEEKTNECYVSCTVSGGDGRDLLNITLFVPDFKQASLVKRNFQKDPNLVYSCMLALLTKNFDLVKTALESIQQVSKKSDQTNQDH